jgi:hypothetical protein
MSGDLTASHIFAETLAAAGLGIDCNNLLQAQLNA